MTVSDEKEIRAVMELGELLKEYEETDEQRRAVRRSRIILDPEAPICINCIYCQHSGIYFECPLYGLPEDGNVVGLWGIVYYYRKGKGGKKLLKRRMITFQ